MWPLFASEVASACGIAAALPPALEKVVISGVTVGDRDPTSDELFVALREGGFDGHRSVEAALLSGAPLALVAADWRGLDELAPDLRARCLVVNDTQVAFRSLASSLRGRYEGPVVAVGGSNGKTTTKDMIAALLSGPDRVIVATPETMNGWTGLPLTLTQREVAAARPPDAIVVEVGIDAAGAMKEHAALVDGDIAVLTALGPEHLTGLGSEEGVVSEEKQLFASSARLRRVFFVEDPKVAELANDARAGDVLVCLSSRRAEHDDLRARGLAILAYEVVRLEPASSVVSIAWQPAGAHHDAVERTFAVPMPGRHLADDFAIAVAVACALERGADDLVRGWETFVPPAMRCQVHDLADGGVLVDDAYNASPASMDAALDLLDADAWRDRPKVLVLGDMLELGDDSARYHLALVDRLARHAGEGARVCLYGSEMEAVHRALAARGVSSMHLPVVADPAAFLDDGSLRIEGAVTLVKGSRGMKLERFLHALASPNALEDDLAPYQASFRTVCVTGTNGKTTTTSLVAAIVAASGETPCRVTTIGAWVGETMTGLAPTGKAFLRTVDLAARRGVRTLAIETTSHALEEGFTRSWSPHVGVFTNLSRDHLDYHGTPERYLAAKAQLFMSLPVGGAAVLNVADPSSALIDEVTPDGVTRLGYCAREPDPSCAAIPIVLRVEAITIDVAGTHARLAPSPLGDALGGTIDLALVGHVHVENALGAALAAHALGYAPSVIAHALSSFTGVPGRFEIVHRAPTVVVDYAHTPDALERTLVVARALVGDPRGRVVCVFGCGGERDPGKRAAMGALAARLADVVVITSDNPRSEDPEVIADEVARGASEGNALLLRLPDRREAIGRAVELAEVVDIVVVAGKGHEKTQTIGDRELPFDDVEVARTALSRRGDTQG